MNGDKKRTATSNQNSATSYYISTGAQKSRSMFHRQLAKNKTLKDPTDTPPPTRVETRDERKDRKRKERAEQVAYKLEQDLAMWDPCSNPEGTTDPFKTLFVARINFDTSESKLRREFEHFGPVKKISLILDKNNSKPRGFAFIEYEHERDMHSAYKLADGKKIDGRRVLVDVERSRTVKGWRPRRLGGGLGGTRKGGADENTKFSGRDDYGGRGDNFRDESRMDRSRSREKERRRPRSRSRERRPRSRSRERRPRSRSRDRDRKDDDRKERKRSRRSRSRERRRSRSKDRKRTRRSRSRDRKRDRRDREKVEPNFPGPNPEDVKQEQNSNDFEYGRPLLPSSTTESTEPDSKWQIVGPALEKEFQEGKAKAQPISEYPYNDGDQQYRNGAENRPRREEEEEPQTAYDDY